MDELKGFFEPESIALIGASHEDSKVGGVLLKKLLNFKGKVIPVNPNHSEIFGLKCYSNILEYAGNIELGIIAIPHDFVFQALEECGKKGIKNAIIISAGFGESGDLVGEKKLQKIAEKYRIRFLGPNCFGVFSPNVNLDCTFSNTTPKKGKVAFISQSGALWSWISDYFYDNGFSGFASLGNMADLSFSDFIEYFLNDKKTQSIVLYIEKLKDGKRFIDICRKSKKKIYAVKAGKSSQGTLAAFSHTGSLATDYEIYKGAFKQAGVELCSSLIEAFSKANGQKYFVKKEKINFKEAVIITNAGGAGALVTDYLNSRGIRVIGPFDILGTAKSLDYKKAFLEHMSESDNFIVIATPQSMTDLENIAREIVNFKKLSGKNILGIFAGKKSIKQASLILKKNKIHVFNKLESLA